LDEAERGKSVTIVRRGVRFRLIVEPNRKPAKAAPALIEVLDPALLEGNFYWDASASGDMVLRLEDSGEAKVPRVGHKRKVSKKQAKP
jgi:hypothetical protein